jgi:hypothetical protein
VPQYLYPITAWSFSFHKTDGQNASPAPYQPFTQIEQNKNTTITSMISLRVVSMFQQAVNTYLQVPILQSSHSITRQGVAKENYEQVSASVGVVIGQGETKF